MKTKALWAAVIAMLVAGCETAEIRDGAIIPGTANPEAPAAQPPVQVARPAAGGPAAAKPAPKKPAILSVTSTELFEFNRSVLNNDAKAKLDKEVIARAKDFANVTLVHVDGHADRLGSHPFNQKLSERRADAVRAYLVSKGFDAQRIETLGSGKTNAVKACPDQKDRKALIECLAPNRRVVVEVKGTPR